MIYRFGAFELDLGAAELRVDGQPAPVEPQVFALLALLVDNRERLVSREEIIDKVWDGRIVSEAAVASRIKSARRALGDDGKAQRFIRTIHGRGFRFVAGVEALAAATASEVPAAEPDREAAAAGEAMRPSIAVLPFRRIGDPEACGAIAEALPHDLITELSRLRWLLVTARGSSFRVRAPETDVREIGRILGVGYCLSGLVEIGDGRLVVTAELADTRDGGVVWSEPFTGAIGDVHRLREELCARILAALDVRIPLHEATRARLTVTEDLDAWSAYHLGLQHMYRFNRADNAVALARFQQAVALDPTFARAHAGLSFVHFQTAFLRHTDDPAGEIALAREYAVRGVELDPLDAFSSVVMGRSFWLEGDLDASLAWLERATSLSPHYAQGLYARAWAESLAGRESEGFAHADLAMRLSPLDPLLYGMLGTRALGHLALGEGVEAARWAERSARAPGAHVLIAMIAVAAHAMAGDEPRAAAWAADVRRRRAGLGVEDFLRAFPMTSPAMRSRVSESLRRFGF